LTIGKGLTVYLYAVFHLSRGSRQSFGKW